MNMNLIESLLNTCSEEVTSDTIAGTWKATQRTSLLNAGTSDTRSNTSWKKAEFVVAFIKDGEPPFNLDAALQGWYNIANGYKRQYLIIEEETDKWSIYDSSKNKIADENTCESFIMQQVLCRLQDRTHQLKSEFKAWLLQQPVQQSGDLISPAIVLSYIGAADKIPEQWNQMSCLWKCSNVPAVEEYIDKAHALNGWQAFNSLSVNGAADSCLEKYKEYLTAKEGDNIHKTPQLGLQRQIIFYGAPGTGKSWKVDQVVKDPAIESVRTTFHPDSDYSTFVGAYKPTMKRFKRVVQSGTNVVDAGVNGISDPQLKEEEKIYYEFVPQAFMNAYTAAWARYADGSKADVVLVIEEINRGNCAQIFGDLFQLLDRNDEGWSSYPILADRDLGKWLAKEYFGTAAFIDGLANVAAPNGIKVEDWAMVKRGEMLLLPPNLYIWATMNTSDQSLFPIDSAFKRRWDWVYVPINNQNKGWKIKVGNDTYDWWKFLDKVNDLIGDRTQSEDKKLGYFFVKPDAKSSPQVQENDLISADRFVGKVVFYLWNDVLKDFDTSEESVFSIKNGQSEREMKFHDFYTETVPAEVEEGVLTRFFECLGLEKDGSGNANAANVAAVGDGGPQTPAQGGDAGNAA